MRRRTLLVALAVVVVNFIGWFGLTPLYPEVAHDLGVTADVFGEIFLAQGALTVVLQLPVGLLSDRIGRRPVILAGLGFMAVGQVVRWQAGSLAAFGLAQLCVGLSAPFVVAPTYALVADAYHAGGRAQAIGILQAVATVGMGAGLVIAGLVSPFAGWRGYSLGIGLLTLALLPLAALQADLRLPPATVAGGPWREAGHALANGLTRRLAGGSVLVAIAWGGSTFVLPFVARANAIGEAGASVLLVPSLAGATVGGIVAGRWADRSGPRLPALALCGLAGASLLIVGVRPFTSALIALSGLLMGAAVSGGAALAAATAAAAAARTGAGTGAAMAIVRSGQSVGTTIAPAVAGFALVHAGMRPTYLLLALAVSAGGAVLAVRPGLQPAARHAYLRKFRYRIRS